MTYLVQVFNRGGDQHYADLTIEAETKAEAIRKAKAQMRSKGTLPKGFYKFLKFFAGEMPAAEFRPLSNYLPAGGYR